MTPEYEKAARTLGNKVVFAELNVDKYQDVSRIYRVRSIPTMILFKNNRIIKRTSGGMGQKSIEAFVKSSL
jgi:thioredoxin-like negative regulator of GroEL